MTAPHPLDPEIAHALRRDLDVLEEQERLLRFSRFDAETAWELGTRLRDFLRDTGAGGTVEIELAGHLLFACATAGANPGQGQWIRRKRNTVHHFARSSYAVGRQLALEGATLSERHALADADFAAHGGGFPLRLEGSGPVGTVVLSGLPQREDHALVVRALAATLHLAVPQLD